jgi:hypothetical protein
VRLATGSSRWLEIDPCFAAGIHPSSGDPIILACGCVPVQTEDEEDEVRSSLAGVIQAGVFLVSINIAIGTVEAVLGAQAEQLRQDAIANGAVARLQAQGFVDSSTDSLLAAALGAFGTDSWQAAVTMAFLTAIMALLCVPLTVVALVRKSRRLTRIAQTFAGLTTALVLLVILSLGASGHLATRNNVGLTALYVAQGLLVCWTLGRVGLRLESLSSEVDFWLFARIHTIDLNVEVMLEMERRREEQEEKIRRALEGDSDNDDTMDERALTEMQEDVSSFFSDSKPQSLVPTATGAAAAATQAVASSGGGGLLGALKAMKAEESRQATSTSDGEFYDQQQAGYDSQWGYSSQPQPQQQGGGYWNADGSYVDESGGITDTAGGYWWPDQYGYSDASGYFYGYNPDGSLQQYPSVPPPGSMAAAQYGGGYGGGTPAPAVASPSQPQVSFSKEAKQLSTFGFEALPGSVEPQEQPAEAPQGRTIQRADTPEDERMDYSPPEAIRSPPAEEPRATPMVAKGVAGPNDKLVVRVPTASASASSASSPVPKPSAGTSILAGIKKMAPKRIMVPTGAATDAAATDTAASSATAQANPPARFPLF